eukprot:TRINITY_DN608_c0_g1_i1.p1 TRINITY_DN608_c0_g1~~TRINITY_DN608_c0_g1_i1.p1  ORF type:complete len:145 (+),score=35.21 TRINITY_DN608_c0_g1_i1:32-466(+)
MTFEQNTSLCSLFQLLIDENENQSLIKGFLVEEYDSSVFVLYHAFKYLSNLGYEINTAETYGLHFNVYEERRGKSHGIALVFVCSKDITSIELRALQRICSNVHKQLWILQRKTSGLCRFNCSFDSTSEFVFLKFSQSVKKNLI